MKKVLSVFLAVLMLFGALSIGASAEETTANQPVVIGGQWFGPAGSGKPATYDQAVLTFDLNGGTMKNSVPVYDTSTGTFVYTEGVSGTYVMLPVDSSAMKAGYYITLPVVTAPTGYQMDGWYCYYDHQTYAPNSSYKIPAGGIIVEFRAAYSPTTLEEDTLTKIMRIMIKIFGAIVGLVMYGGDTEAGVALMEKVLGGVLG